MAKATGPSQPAAAPVQPHVFKLVLLGSGSVGKSSLALRYVRDKFHDPLPTVGCAFFTKELSLGVKSVKLEIWDTAGQEKYHSVCHLYFRGAQAAVLVYDITRKDSLGQAQRWLQELRQENNPEDVVVMLEGKEFAESQGLLFMEASALLGDQVTELFTAVAQELLQREEQKDAVPQQGSPLPLDGAPTRQSKCCAH